MLAFTRHESHRRQGHSLSTAFAVQGGHSLHSVFVASGVDGRHSDREAEFIARMRIRQSSRSVVFRDYRRLQKRDESRIECLVTP